MYALGVVILFALIPNPVQSGQSWTHKRFSYYATSYHIGQRVINLTKSTYHDASQRISDTNNMRFMYEKTPFYEQGYLFSEIIERYKKAVEHYKKMISFSSIQVFDSFDRVEHIHKLYFEIYNLVGMMHEIPKKYSQTPEFTDLLKSDEDKERIRKAKEAFAKAEKEREKQAKLLMLAQKQAAEKKVGGAGGILLGLQSKEKYFSKGGGPSELGKLFPKRWPKDYGWEPPDW